MKMFPKKNQRITSEGNLLAIPKLADCDKLRKTPETKKIIGRVLKGSIKYDCTILMIPFFYVTVGGRILGYIHCLYWYGHWALIQLLGQVNFTSEIYLHVNKYTQN